MPSVWWKRDLVGLVIKPKEVEKRIWKRSQLEIMFQHVEGKRNKQFFDINSGHIKRREKLVSSIQPKYIFHGDP